MQVVCRWYKEEPVKTFAYYARVVGAWWLILGLILKVAAMFHGLDAPTLGGWPILILVAIMMFLAHRYLKQGGDHD